MKCCRRKIRQEKRRRTLTSGGNMKITRGLSVSAMIDRRYAELNEALSVAGVETTLVRGEGGKILRIYMGAAGDLCFTPDGAIWYHSRYHDYDPGEMEYMKDGSGAIIIGLIIRDENRRVINELVFEDLRGLQGLPNLDGCSKKPRKFQGGFSSEEEWRTSVTSSPKFEGPEPKGNIWGDLTEILRMNDWDDKEVRHRKVIRGFAGVINKASRENDSDTPDFILAEFLHDVLLVFEKTLEKRKEWRK